MRKLVVPIMASLLSCSAAFAFWPEATDSSLEVGVGYRVDKLEWKTASHADSGSSSSDSYGCGLPFGVQSKLKWHDLQIWQIEAKGKYVTCDNVYLRANADYGWITHGKNTDSDYIDVSCSGYSSSSEFEFARSKSKAKGHVYDAKIAVGYQFKMCDDSFAIAPLVGYSWHGQHINDNHTKQNFYVDDASFSNVNVDIARTRAHSYSSSFSDCSSYDSYGSSSDRDGSRYHTRWNGPFLGFDFDYRFGCGCEADWELFGSYEFHWAQYNAKAHWDMRKDLCDGFRHHAKNAYGNVFDIGVKWDFCECWTLALKGEFQWWWADKGHDRAKIAQNRCGDVKTDCFLKIPLRDIKWQSASVSIDVGMVF